jgi:phage-related protein
VRSHYYCLMRRNTVRQVSWVKRALKDFQSFPQAAQEQASDALTMIAEGDTPEIAKPLTNLGSGVWELAIKDRGNAFRVVYLLRIDVDIWVIYAFQKKSTIGISTPKHEIDLVRERIKRLKEALS